jgi:hypothetical protein
MRVLSFIVLCLMLVFSDRQPGSPHGPDFKISCGNCHSPEGWQFNKTGYTFDHSTTKMPLVGQHTEIECKQCHTTLVFSDAKSECNACHNDVHQATVGPECSRCHTPSSWLVSDINDIHRMGRFPLLGAHRTADCIQCHKSESLVRFDVLGVECIDCHREDYMSTTSPNHTEAGFPEDCASCHPVNSFQWTGAGFNHSFFPLVQAHSIPECADCHTTGNYADASQECYSCHQTDYTAATNPDHAASNFPTTCQECHTLNPGWKPASFNHSSFPLTLGHAGPVCTDCHINGNYSSTPTDCYACHQSDYNETTNPNHQSLAFSVSCTECHTTNPGWKPAAYRQHDSQSFPIYSGRHNGKWDTCTDCHTNPSNYAEFSCITCHEHNKTDMDNKHQDENGYSYNSSECLRCHPTGNAE